MPICIFSHLYTFYNSGPRSLTMFRWGLIDKIIKLELVIGLHWRSVFQKNRISAASLSSGIGKSNTAAVVHSGRKSDENVQHIHSKCSSTGPEIMHLLLYLPHHLEKFAFYLSRLFYSANDCGFFPTSCEGKPRVAPLSILFVYFLERKKCNGFCVYLLFKGSCPAESPRHIHSHVYMHSAVAWVANNTENCSLAIQPRIHCSFKMRGNITF